MINRLQLFSCLLILLPLKYSIADNDLSKDQILRINSIVSRWTYSEMLSLIRGINGIYTGNVNGIQRFRVPALKMEDGPQGFRTSKHTGKDGTTTSWPCSLAVSASWDTNLTYHWASAMASEFRKKGANVLLGPGVGVARVPNNGRIFEYLSGEDPYLGSIIVKSYIEGVHSQNILACVKHFTNNEQETHRMTMSSQVDERTRFELYYPPFESAIRAGVLVVMCAYNKVNGIHACENRETISELRQVLGFKGWIMSDWLATHSTIGSLEAGLDQELPIGLFYSEEYINLSQRIHHYDLKLLINASATRILTAMVKGGLMDRRDEGDPEADVTSSEHRKLAREIATKSAVLLKNDGFLPLKLARYNDVNHVDGSKFGGNRGDNGQINNTIANILVVGDDAEVVGSGSGRVEAAHVVSVREALSEELARRRVTEVISVAYVTGQDVTKTINLAKDVDFVLVVVGVSSGEGRDRSTLSLSGHDDRLINSLSAACATSIVIVVRTPGAVLLPWIDQPNIRGVLLTFLPGQEAGYADVDILVGNASPTGRLPITIPRVDNEVQFTPEQYPGNAKKEARYSEQLCIGYRWYHSFGEMLVPPVKPLFPFGYGLSYSRFEYYDLVLSTRPVQHVQARSTHRDDVDNNPVYKIHRNDLFKNELVVSFSVKNIGNFHTVVTDVSQLYVTHPLICQEPPRQLKGLLRVALHAGESSLQSFTLSTRDLSVWDEYNHLWTVSSGLYILQIGRSSTEFHLHAEVLFE